MDRLQSILNQTEFSREDIIYLLSVTDEAALEKIHAKAYEIKKDLVGTIVHFRGIVEFSNICTKNCLYCGIRKENKKLSRYQMSTEEILAGAKWAYESGYGSIVLQSGERQDKQFTTFIENLLKEIKELSDGKLGITLSLGEQTFDTYKRWFEAGAHRYLLRIETSNRELYRNLHPQDHDFETRLMCLTDLRDIGYQVGTGVMIGLPGQSPQDLADDIIFFKDYDIDMIGMGPFIPHSDTPMATALGDFSKKEKEQLDLALLMIATTRIVLKDVNIASTTALQTLNHTGREMGLKAGANIIMPNITDTRYRAAYQLYDNKPCLDENSSMCKDCLGKRITSIGETIGYNQWGDSRHFVKRNKR